MTIANQIGLGICLALVPYVLWVAGSAALNTILDWVAPPKIQPIFMQSVFAATHYQGDVIATTPKE